MITPPSTLRLSAEERSWLLWVRTRTGLTTYAVPCRWALGLSLRAPTDPPAQQFPGDGLEIAWSTLGVAPAELWWACVVARYGEALAKLEEMLRRARKIDVAHLEASQLPLKAS